MDGHQFEENINGIAQLHLARAKPAPSEHSMSSSSLYKESEPDASNIPEEVLSQAFALLPQRQR